MNPSLKKIFRVLAWPLYRVWYFQYRFRPNFEPDVLPEMQPQETEGYSDKYFYYRGEEIIFYLKSPAALDLAIEKSTGPLTWTSLLEITSEEAITQPAGIADDMGLSWNASFRWDTGGFSAGYYRAVLSCAESKNKEFFISFIVGEKKKDCEVLIIAPLSTWTAYNPYGGKSAYKNILDKRNVHQLSAQRPNTALQYNAGSGNIHDMNVEINIFNFFSSLCNTDIIPDYFLENDGILKTKAQIIVLSYHCEYFSPASYLNLRKLVYKGNKSLISLGANQVYWKVMHDKNYQTMEVRKDHTWFSGSFTEGEMWRQSLYPEKDLLGVQFSDPGTGTYAPFRVLNENHWLFEGMDVKNGMLFGEKGMNNLPVCGDETDKADPAAANEVEIIAEGINCREQGNMIVWPDPHYNWNGAGGGAIALKKLSDRHAVLSTGAISSGSGLGADAIFTGIIKNFVKKYLNKGFSGESISTNRDRP